MATIREQILESDGYGTVKSDKVMITGDLRELKEAMTSDGFHTFDELYRYRMLYNALAFNMLSTLPGTNVHKSRFHSDGEPCFGGGWFIVVAYVDDKQISNHYEEKDWDLFSIEERIRADEWDGHTPEEAAQRIEDFLKS
jgi:hypothetical protein